MSSPGPGVVRLASRRAPTAVIVGAGFGGLALACRLQAAGVQVTLVEKRKRVGGRAYQLREGGYTFDMGPSLITAPHILDSVFQAGGRRLWDYVDLVPLDPYYRIHFHDGSQIDYTGDREAMRSQMARFHPGDAARLDTFLDAVEPIYEAVIEDRLGSSPFDSLSRMAGFLPRMLRMGGHRSVGSFVERYFEDPRHRFLYSFHPLFVGGHPYATPSVYLMIPYLERTGGVWFTRGGMYSVVEAMASLFAELGGVIRTGEEVEEILVRNGRAVGIRTRSILGPEPRPSENGGPPPSPARSSDRDGRGADEGTALENSDTIHADLVVSNGDPGHTYGDLVSADERRRWSDRRL
ncbi:MAG: phytoene desaturase family protein, partial [Longimicrobiales bacterium]|nr:phytoene desaturase family protein [Longimicrobiales bacterium]